MKRIWMLSMAVFLAIAMGIGAQVNKPALVIRANVEGADITLNGIPLGKTSPNFAILLDPGSYSLKVAKPGYSEFSTLITLPAESLIVDVNLVAFAAPPPSSGPAPTPPPPPPSGGSSSTQSGNYTIVRNGAGETMRALARGPSQFVAVGNSMFALNSADGKRWSSPQKIPGTGNFVSVRWVKDRYFAPGDYGLLYSSSDGQSWQRQSTGSTKHLGPAAWMAGRFFIVGQSGTMLASSNGASWSQLAISYSNNFLNIAAEKSTLVVTGSQGLILYSTDGGVVWNKATSGVTDNLFGLAAGPAGFVAGGSSQRAPLLFSPDGKSWSIVYRSDSSQTYGAIIWDGDRFIVAASYGEVLESRDGREWRKLPAIPNGKHAVGVATDGTTIVIAQSDGTIVAFPKEAPTGGSFSGGPGAGGPSPSLSIPTPASPPSTVSMKTMTLLNEDFENAEPLAILPRGWLGRDNKNPSYTHAWAIDQDGRNSHSGNRFATMVFGTSKAMITPPLHLAGGGTATLSFWARNRNPSVKTNLTVLLSHGGSDQGDFRWELGRIRGVPDSYQKFTFEIGPEHGGGTFRVMFLGDEPEEGQIIHVDDVEIVARVPDSTPTTQALKPFVLIDENFENKAPAGILPPGWMSRDNKNPQNQYAWDCTIDNRNAHSGIQFTMASGTDKGLITPAFNVPSGGATVSFWLRNRDPRYGGNLDVLLSYGGTEQRDFTDTLGRIRGAPDSYQLFAYEIGALYAGRTVRIMFYAPEPQQGQILQIDDVKVEGKQ
ncbi:MAG TPA: PEGA domain-containing protein [Rectinemataceae bacterium]